MSLSAAAMRLLADKGLSLDDIIAVAEANEAARLAPALGIKPNAPGGPEPVRTGYRVAMLVNDEWWRLRNSIILRDGFTCAYCEDQGEASLTADHIIPLSRGGSNDPSNLVCCCVPCNSSKRNLLLSEWRGRQTSQRVRDFSHIKGHEA